MSLQSIIDDCGLKIFRTERVSGGDINYAYRLNDNDRAYFLKINSASAYEGMLKKEANGLEKLRGNFSLCVPKVLKTGTVNDQQYLLLEWIESGNREKNFWKDFGFALANMHNKEQPFFGFEEDNFIGSLIQRNNKLDLWSDFYTECRILPLAKQLHSSGSFSKEDLLLIEKFCNKIADLFPKEKPSLLHGDLWSGNFMCEAKGQACIYDPAVYYGHREMDLGMTKLFGGFDQIFYEAYHTVYPLEKGWEERLPLTQLYPLLVHAVLFGGGYVESARGIIKKYSGD
jgi:protein-ribulosamine 3-kinase